MAALPAYGQHSAAALDIALPNPTTCKPHNLARCVRSTSTRAIKDREKEKEM